MNLEELQGWILSDDGLASEIELVSRRAAGASLGLTKIADDVAVHEPNWRRLMLAASVLGANQNAAANEAALMVAHAGIHSGHPSVVDSSATLLTQLANERAVHLAEEREHLEVDFKGRLGAVERLLVARRDFENALFLPRGGRIDASKFQRNFWNDLTDGGWITASAPTASGKTYLVLRWLLNEFVFGRIKLAIVIAPTRALVSEVERELLDLSADHEIGGLRVASLPLAELGDMSRPTILVFTQERLHVFLNAIGHQPRVDVAIVDEVHKLGDRLRGVILQDAIERISRCNSDCRFVFLSPLTENPEVAVQDAPMGRVRRVRSSDTPTVTQHLIVASQKPRDSQGWQLTLIRNSASSPVGELRLHARPDTDSKRLSFVALAIGRTQTGTLVYSNGAAEAEKTAWQIYDALGEGAEAAADSELTLLSDFIRDTVHPRFQLVELVRRGVAFHYGNMPSLLRSEIERLFKTGKLRFLVCTSTLIEGVNLACRTIVVRGPKKGRGNPMGPHDFWNLAGRAGRWGQDFQGNIVCVDVNRPKLWPEGVPQRAKYPIRRETESVLTQRAELLDYLQRRPELGTFELNDTLEQVIAYLLAWTLREGTWLTSPAAQRLDAEYSKQIDDLLKSLLALNPLPEDLVTKHPGVSAAAMGSLLRYFQGRSGSAEELVPSSPESDDAYPRLIQVFHRINSNMYPAFLPNGLVPLHALVTLEWMRGMPLAQIIRRRIEYFEEKRKPIKLPKIIRDTMAEVEDVARFRAPKYLAAYVDVLRHHLDRVGQSELLPSSLRLDLFLEFGVATRTLLSLIGLGLSRTSAVAINDFLADDDLSEEAVFNRLARRDWESLDVPVIVKREIGETIARRNRAATAG